MPLEMTSTFATIVILLWVTLITFSPLPWGEGCSEVHKRALIEIRNSTNGFAFQGWDGKSCCEADGIICDSTTRVIMGIDLDGSNWTLSSAWYPNVTLFSLFDKLEALDLKNTQIGGGLQPFCELKRLNYLRELTLSNTALDGHVPLCLGMIANLQSLDLSDNDLIGLLPEIGDLLPKLYFVDMSSNALEGKIPNSIGNLSLRYLDLSNNTFTDTIPQSLTRDGTLIEYLDLSTNTLEGEMLPKGSNMTRLQCLQLGNNYFEGIISPMISNSPSLAILEVQNNQLSGNIPRWLYDHPSLVAVVLSGNHLEGHLLQRMCQMKKLQVFDISNNHMSGGIPNCLDNITFWKKISPSHNYFHFSYSTLTDIGMPLRKKHMVYTYKGITLSKATAIDLSSNQLTSSIPFEIGKLSYLLHLNLSNNYLIGPLPNSLKNLVKMESLDLSRNKLSGKIPPNLVQLTSLSTFSVAYNNLSGRIPFEQQFSAFEMQSYDGNPRLCGEPLPRKCSRTNGLEDEHKSKIETKGANWND